jgi:hypothetical protein
LHLFHIWQIEKRKYTIRSLTTNISDSRSKISDLRIRCQNRKTLTRQHYFAGMDRAIVLADKSGDEFLAVAREETPIVLLKGHLASINLCQDTRASVARNDQRSRLPWQKSPTYYFKEFYLWDWDKCNSKTW